MNDYKMTPGELRATWGLGTVFSLRMLGMFMVLPVLTTYGMALRGYKVEDDKVWARKLFVFSIVAITSLSVMMSVDFMVPDSHNLLTYVW